MSSAGIPVFEIPLRPTSQRLSVQLDGTTYILTVIWRDADQGGWFMDMADSGSNPILNGIPLITGADLLKQYGYLGFGGKLFVQSDANPDDVPTYTDLGSTSHLYWYPNP